MTKREESMVRAYEYAYDRGIRTVLTAYGKPSAAKIKAENEIMSEMLERGGYGYCICGCNSCTFSCGYKYRKDDGEYLVYHTYANRYEIKL